MTARLDEVKSGLRLALTVVGAILIIGLLGRGLQLIRIGGRGNVALGIGSVLVVCGILFVTVGRWAKWFFAACCLFTLRAIVITLLGRTISVPSIVAPRILGAEIVGLLGVMVFLSFRFVGTKPNWVDSVCLIGAVIAFVYSLLANGDIRWMLVAVLLLGVSTAYSKFVARPQQKPC